MPLAKVKNNNKMENKNAKVNLFIKQMNQSDAMAYNMEYVATPTNQDYGILNKAYANTGKIYAKLKTTIEANKCTEPGCAYEIEQINRLENAPQKSLEFITNVMAELNTTEDVFYDVCQNYAYTVANCVMKKKPGFGRNEGYNIEVNLLEDSSQEIIFEGPFFEQALKINSSTLDALTRSDSNLVAETPDINKEMLRLLTEINIMEAKSVDPNSGVLTPHARISDEFVLKNSDGSYDYEIIDIGMGKGRNLLKFDMDKIKRKASPFINAEVAGLLESEQEAVAAWNVFLAQDTSVEEDNQMVQNANAGSLVWEYEQVLPLSQVHKIHFEQRYREYFYQNYLIQFTTNQLPTVEEDAVVFDLKEGKEAKAQKFIEDNKLS